VAGPFPASQGAIITVGLLYGQHRLQCVIPMISDTAAGTPTQRGTEFQPWLEDTIYPAWLPVLPEECQIVGFMVEGMGDDSILPFRINYPLNTYDGTGSAGGTPPQVSQLIAFYSDTQIALAARTAVGKMNVGPCPEDANGDGVVLTGQVTLLQTLGGLLASGFVGASSGTHWYRALAAHPLPAADVHVANLVVARTNLFTQRRRLTPLL